MLLENFVSYNDHNVIMGKSYSFTVISYDTLSSDGTTQTYNFQFVLLSTPTICISLFNIVSNAVSFINFHLYIMFFQMLQIDLWLREPMIHLLDLGSSSDLHPSVHPLILEEYFSCSQLCKSQQYSLIRHVLFQY